MAHLARRRRPRTEDYAPHGVWRTACAAHLAAAPVPTFLYGGRGRTLHARNDCPASPGLLQLSTRARLRTLDNPADPGGTWNACDICFHPAAASLAVALNMRSAALAAAGPQLLLHVHNHTSVVKVLRAMRRRRASLDPSDDPWGLGLADAAAALDAALDVHLLRPDLPTSYVVAAVPATWLTRAAAIQLGLSATLHPLSAGSPHLLNHAVVDLIDPALLHGRCHPLHEDHLDEQLHLLQLTYTPERDLSTQVSAVRAATR